MTYIAPSLLAADYAHLADEIKKVEDAGANYLHLDIMARLFPISALARGWSQASARIPS